MILAGFSLRRVQLSWYTKACFNQGLYDFSHATFFNNSNINIFLYRTAEAREMKFEAMWIYF